MKGRLQFIVYRLQGREEREGQLIVSRLNSTKAEGHCPSVEGKCSVLRVKGRVKEIILNSHFPNNFQ